MSVYTYTNARQNLARLLDEASDHMEVYIKRQNGQLFKLVVVEDDASGLDVPGIDVDITIEEIVAFIRTLREER